jgi:hypothetical protein
MLASFQFGIICLPFVLFCCIEYEEQQFFLLLFMNVKLGLTN